MPRSITIAMILLLMLCGVSFAADRAGLWIDVPFVAQQGEGCGAATLAMVMQYWQRHEGLAANPGAQYGAIERALYSPAAHGIYASAMQHYLEQNGYKVIAFAGEWDDLTRNLAKGRPLIVALKPGAGLPLHYVVVAGLDPARKVVLVNDPAQRKLLEEDQARFEQAWKGAGHWTLLAVPETAAH
jgi:ABC-type bacteriocin/lantibiotic exporter with double-glycine peptidase domain